MAGKEKFDGVVTAVRYAPDGQVDWVRMFERRGPTFSDRVMIHRAELVALLKAGKKIVVGDRIPYQASTFNVTGALKLAQAGGKDILLTNAAPNQSDKDVLTGVPLL